jgi:hypothetical protein
MSELVEEDATEQRQSEQDAFDGRRDTVPLYPMAEGDPANEDEECRVHVDHDAGELTQLQRPFHPGLRGASASQSNCDTTRAGEL